MEIQEQPTFSSVKSKESPKCRLSETNTKFEKKLQRKRECERKIMRIYQFEVMRVQKSYLGIRTIADSK